MPPLLKLFQLLSMTFECVKTNVLGAMNLIDACIDKGVRKVVALSTDKASSPEFVWQQNNI